jgi:predicted nucleotidyltransferase
MKKVVPLSVSMKEIQEYVLRIAQTFKPQKVILFGSYAYGKPQEASDVDILVVMDTPLRSTEQAIQIRKTIRAPFPLDLIVRTPQEIKNRLLMGDFFIKEIFSKGKVLYEASDQRVD